MPKPGISPRCPICNRYGSPKLGGYCRRCYDTISAENKGTPLVRKDFRPSYGEGFRDKEWTPKEFGIIKDSFGA